MHSTFYKRENFLLDHCWVPPSILSFYSFFVLQLIKGSRYVSLYFILHLCLECASSIVGISKLQISINQNVVWTSSERFLFRENKCVSFQTEDTQKMKLIFVFHFCSLCTRTCSLQRNQIYKGTVGVVLFFFSHSCLEHLVVYSFWLVSFCHFKDLMIKTSQKGRSENNESTRNV